MRKFYLQNEYGDRKELQSGSFFLWQPSGFGLGNETQYMETERFFIAVSGRNVQEDITGTFVFKSGKPYEAFKSLADWLVRAEKLTLGYSPDGDWYCADVALVRLDKGELNSMGVLEVPVVFAALSPWYSPYNLNISLGGERSTKIKRYAYCYPYKYSNSNRAGAVSFTLDSQIDSGFRLVIPGPIERPVFEVRRLDNGKVIGRVDLSSIYLKKGETIRYSALPSDAGAWLETPRDKTDLTELIELSPDAPAFFTIPVGVPIEVVLKGASLYGINAQVSIQRFYRTV